MKLYLRWFDHIEWKGIVILSSEFVFFLSANPVLFVIKLCSFVMVVRICNSEVEGYTYYRCRPRVQWTDRVDEFLIERELIISLGK